MFELSFIHACIHVGDTPFQFTIFVQPLADIQYLFDPSGLVLLNEETFAVISDELGCDHVLIGFQVVARKREIELTDEILNAAKSG